MELFSQNFFVICQKIIKITKKVQNHSKMVMFIRHNFSCRINHFFVILFERSIVPDGADRHV